MSQFTAATKTNMESPAGDAKVRGNGTVYPGTSKTQEKASPVSMDSPAQMGGKVGNAGQLPVKTYPASTAMATKGPSNTIEGPCSGQPGSYTK